MYTRLSKEISYALRHAPWEYELEMDEEGWVPIEQLLDALHRENDWKNVTQEDIQQMIDVSDKKRHEIIGSRIRAFYYGNEKVWLADAISSIYIKKL